MNKFNLFALALLAISAQNVKADDKFEYTEVSCRDARHIFDAGYEVVIKKDSPALVREREATLYSQSIMGPIVLGKSLVGRVDTKNQRVYAAKNFKLTVNMNKPVKGERPEYASVVKALVNNRDVKANLICEVKPEPAIEPIPGGHGGVTCMAFWSGAAYDAAQGKCVQRGGSGCSNPFPFFNLADCEEAYSFK